MNVAGRYADVPSAGTAAELFYGQLCELDPSPRRTAGMTSSANRRKERIVCSPVSVPKKKEPTK